MAGNYEAPSEGSSGLEEAAVKMNEVQKPEYTGTVKTADETKAFIECVDLKEQFGGQDVYVHPNVGAPVGLMPGDVVAFNLHVSKDNKPQASAPLWKLVGQLRPDQELTFGPCIG